jgi:hypothetical protein
MSKFSATLLSFCTHLLHCDWAYSINNFHPSEFVRCFCEALKLEQYQNIKVDITVKEPAGPQGCVSWHGSILVANA